MRRSIALACALALLAAPAAAGDDPPRQKRTPKVLLIGIDGLRPDALLAADTPNVDALAADGAISLTAHAGDETVSGPGWSSVLTGVWRDKHAVADNRFEGNCLAAFPCFFKRVKEKRPDVVTAAFVSWDMLE